MKTNPLFDFMLKLYGEIGDMPTFLNMVKNLTDSEKKEAIVYFSITEYFDLRTDDEERDFNNFLAYFEPGGIFTTPEKIPLDIKILINKMLDILLDMPFHYLSQPQINKLNITAKECNIITKKYFGGVS